MEFDVPEVFAQVTKCFASDVLQDGKVLVGLCTTSGQLLELVDKKVIDSFDFEKDADEVHIFTSYNPVQKYFLVLCNKQLIVIKRTKPLSVIKTFENVVGVEIRDRLCLGRPQAVIWTVGEEEPTVTDFVGELRPAGPQPVPPLTSSLSGKLQETNLRLESACKLLQEKRSARLNALHELAPHLKPPGIEAQGEPKVLVWGPPFSAQSKISPPPLQLSRPWRRVHNGKWILGVPVYNCSHTSVEELSLRLQRDGESESGLQYRTQLVVFPQRESTGAEWMEPKGKDHTPRFLRQAHVPAGSPAVMLGVLEEPVFKTSSAVTISGVLLYRQTGAAGQRTQDILEPVQFRVEDLVQGSLRPFSSLNRSADESDMVSVAVTSSQWQLQVSSRHGLSTPLLLSDFGLQLSPSMDCWLGQPHGSLCGVMVLHQRLSSSQHLLELYAKDTKQALLFVHGLLEQWTVEVCGNSTADVSSCAESLAAELRLLLTVAKPNSVFTAEQWADLREKLNSLELKTDLAFASCVPSK